MRDLNYTIISGSPKEAYRNAIKKTTEAEQFVSQAKADIFDAKENLVKAEQNLRNAEFFLQAAQSQERKAFAEAFKEEEEN